MSAEAKNIAKVLGVMGAGLLSGYVFYMGVKGLVIIFLNPQFAYQGNPGEYEMFVESVAALFAMGSVGLFYSLRWLWRGRVAQKQ